MWRDDLEVRAKWQSAMLIIGRVLYMAATRFLENLCHLRASALTFYTLLSIVPVMAMAFGVAKGFGLEEKLLTVIHENLASHSDVVTKVVEFAQSLLANTRGGLVAGIGVALLFWTVIKLMSNIESSFNAIWEITKDRSVFRKISEYLSIMIIAPVFLIISSSATVFIAAFLRDAVQRVDALQVVGPVLLAVMGLVPYFMLWVLFTFIYVVMPNTRVRLKPAFIAAIVAGTTFQMAQWGYVNFQVGVVKYNAIYGSFAALPLFLIWLQLAWLIVLFGGEVAFALQNFRKYLPGSRQPGRRLRADFRRRVILLVASHLASRFKLGQPPQTSSMMADQLRLTEISVREAVSDLERAGVIIKVPQDGAEPGYQPAADPRTLSMSEVIARTESIGLPKNTMIHGSLMQSIDDALRVFAEGAKKSTANKSLDDLSG